MNGRVTFARYVQIVVFLSGAAVLGPVSATAAGEEEAVFVEDGVPKLVQVVGQPWKQGEGYIECGGPDNFLFPNKAGLAAVEIGDCTR